MRFDAAVAGYEDPTSGDSGLTVASMLLGSYKVLPRLSGLVRLPAAQSLPPAGDAAFVLGNPFVGATLALPVPSPYRLALFGGVTLPVGTGGGTDADPSELAATRAAMASRSAMDNAMFAVNDVALVPGVDLAYLAGGFTAQVEATLLQLVKVRGGANNPDDAKTNLTVGLHLGWFPIPRVSLGTEIRHQRWLSTPRAIAADPTGTLRDTTTVAAGVRVHLELAGKQWLRPGVSYARGLDDPFERAATHVLQIDVPFLF